MPDVPVREGLFATDSNGNDHLIGGRCGSCSRYHFPIASTCPYCGADRITLAELSDTGTLWAWTAVTALPPGYRGSVPFGFGIVELPEGIRIVSRIEEADPHRLASGMPVKLGIEALYTDDEGNRVVTYTFVPALST